MDSPRACPEIRGQGVRTPIWLRASLEILVSTSLEKQLNDPFPWRNLMVHAHETDFCLARSNKCYSKQLETGASLDVTSVCYSKYSGIQDVHISVSCL